jgi:hypothetical protein
MGRHLRVREIRDVTQGVHMLVAAGVEMLVDRYQAACGEGDEPSVRQVAGAWTDPEAAEPDVRRDLVPGARRGGERPRGAVSPGRARTGRGRVA